MSIITLLSDYGYKDHYVAAVKGKIVSLLSNVTIIDITHGIDSFNVYEAAHNLKHAFHHFPENTIHIILVNIEKELDLTHVVAKINNHFFIAPDNGILEFVSQDYPVQEIVVLENINNSNEIDLFIDTAARISNNEPLKNFGPQKKQLHPFYNLQVTHNDKYIKGHVVYIDHFGNCVTNISKKLFETYNTKNKFQIAFKNVTLTRIHKIFSDFKVTENKSLQEFEGDFLAKFNEAGFLEISIFKSNLKTTGTPSSLKGLEFRDFVHIMFLD